MLKLLIISSLLGITQLTDVQVSKVLKITCIPEGALITKVSGRSDFLGNAPIQQEFNFHSDVSIQKLKFSACGYYDTIVKINPKTEHINIIMNRKKFVILPATEMDVLQENESSVLSESLNKFLTSFIACNAKEPINFNDFAIVSRSDDGIDINLIFELDPAYLPVKRGMNIDSVLQDRWNTWFQNPVGKLTLDEMPRTYSTNFFLSVVSGKNNISIRHIPGVNVRNERQVDVSVYEDQYKRVTTTTSYYVTVTSPEFNTQLNQSQKYYELLYMTGLETGNESLVLAQKALLSYRNGKLSTNYASTPEIVKHSMLNRFLNH